MLRQAEFFLLGGYHLRHVMVHVVEQVVMHFVLKAPAVMEEAAAVSEQGCSGAGRSSDAGPSQIQEHSAGEGRLQSPGEKTQDNSETEVVPEGDETREAILVECVQV